MAENFFSNRIKSIGTLLGIAKTENEIMKVKVEEVAGTEEQEQATGNSEQAVVANAENRVASEAQEAAGDSEQATEANVNEQKAEGEDPEDKPADNPEPEKDPAEKPEGDTDPEPEPESDPEKGEEAEVKKPADENEHKDKNKKEKKHVEEEGEGASAEAASTEVRVEQEEAGLRQAQPDSVAQSESGQQATVAEVAEKLVSINEQELAQLKADAAEWNKVKAEYDNLKEWAANAGHVNLVSKSGGDVLDAATKKEISFLNQKAIDAYDKIHGS